MLLQYYIEFSSITSFIYSQFTYVRPPQKYLKKIEISTKYDNQTQQNGQFSVDYIRRLIICSFTELPINNMNVHTVLTNKYGGLYEQGIPYTPAQWTRISQVYLENVRRNGTCSIKTLAIECQISTHTALRAIKASENSSDVPTRYARGHGCSGVGSIRGMTMIHHVFIYQSYVNNPSLPIDGYIEELYDRFSLIVSPSLITRWFKTIDDTSAPLPS